MAKYYTPKVPSDWMLERIKTDLICNEDGSIVWASPKNKNIKAGTVAGWVDENGYTYIRLMKTVGGKSETRCLAAHHIIWFAKTGEWPTKEVDHINGRRSDNRFVNLRLADREQQMWNLRQRSGLKYPTGVERINGGRYRARIRVEGRTRHLGVFDTPEEAHDVFLEVARQYRPGFALLPPKDEAA